MNRILLLIIMLMGTSFYNYGESLWDTEFQGYLIPGSGIEQGDILNVVIETSFSLSHITTQQDSKTISFEYTGGEYGDLFSFLPDITADVDNSTKGSEKYDLSTEMVARVVTLEDNFAYLEGNREIIVDGKKESISISGYINTGDIDQQKRIFFSKMADSRLVYQTFLYPSDPVLTEEDIKEIVKEIIMIPEETVPAEEITEEGTGDTTVTEEEQPAPGEAEPATVPSGEEEAPLQPEKTTPELTKEKKKELFLRYVNRMIDLLFY